MSTLVEQIGSDVVALRSSFEADKTRPLAARKATLRQIKKLIIEGEQELQAAVKKDLNKHQTELYLMEYTGILGEIQDHLDHMEDWVKPKKVSSNIVNIPSHSAIVTDPLGVVGIISTWNYPVMLTFQPLVGCISAGNCALVRLPPDGTSDNTSAVMAKLIKKYLDPDVVRIVTGGLEASKVFLAQRYDLIFCTGGSIIGKIVAKAAAETLTPIVLELGGKSPTIVDASCNLQMAAKRVAWAAFVNCGQTCIRPDYVFVHSSIGDEFVTLVRHQLSVMFGTNVEKSDCYGRLVNQTQYKRIEGIVQSNKQYIVAGGDLNEKERYVGPTILNYKSDFEAFKKSSAMEGELFGPVLPICYLDKVVKDSVRYINEHPKPLSLYIFTTDSKVHDYVVNHTSSGSVCINDCMVQTSNPNLPFGGVGNSGMGSYHGKHSIIAFSHQKSVMYKYNILDIPQRYMPYTPSNERFLRMTAAPIPRAVVRVAIVAAISIVIGVVLCVCFL